jgi:hypothetical protein
MLAGATPHETVPLNTAMGVTIRSSRVAVRQWHAAKNLGGSAIFAEQENRMTLRRPLRLQPLRQAHPSSLSHGASSR